MAVSAELFHQRAELTRQLSGDHAAAEADLQHALEIVRQQYPTEFAD